MNNSANLLVVAVMFFIVAVATGYWAVTSKPLQESDCTTITGTLKSANEFRTGRSDRYLEFYIAEHSARFRIPADGYEEFNREAFFANVKPGDRIVITAEKKELEAPFRPPLDPVDTVFVHGLRDRKMAYCTLAGRKQWEVQNRVMGGFFAVIMGVISVFFMFTAVGARSGASSGSTIEAINAFRSQMRQS